MKEVKLIQNGVYVHHENNLIPIEEWVKREDAKSAKSLILITDHCCIEIDKTNIGNSMTWGEAQGATAQIDKRSITHHEGIEIYEARYKYDLDNAFKSIGGEPMDGWYWTCYEDVNPKYSASLAWRVSTYAGNTYYDHKSAAYMVRAVAAFQMN